MKIKTLDGTHFRFWCSACQTTHIFAVPPWRYNGDANNPTVEESVLTIGSKFSRAGEEDYVAWIEAGCPDRKGKSFDSIETRCHLQITNGSISYYNDCTHALAGKAVGMENLE